MKYLSSGQHFHYYQSMRKCFSVHGQVTLKRIVRSGRKSNLSMILSTSSKFEEDPIKMKVLSFEQHFSHCKSVGAFGCHGN